MTSRTSISQGFTTVHKKPGATRIQSSFSFHSFNLPSLLRFLKSHNENCGSAKGISIHLPSVSSVSRIWTLKRRGIPKMVNRVRALSDGIECFKKASSLLASTLSVQGSNAS